jgi:hypothetical protein
LKAGTMMDTSGLGDEEGDHGGRHRLTVGEAFGQ